MIKSNKILLFISKDSIYFRVTMDEFKKLLKALQEMQSFKAEIIDVNEDPDKAEKYKVDALPTLIIGDKRFVGQPKADEILKLIEE